jgi:formate dehydrogenase subunit gamma
LQQFAPVQTQPAPTDSHPADLATIPTSPSILRFLAGERMVHWALAIPFVLLYTTALGMVVTYGESAPRPFHHAFALVHRGLGVALIALPPLALWRGLSDWRAHVANVKEAWRWTPDDYRWLVLFPRAAVNPRVVLPEQGKFNAAEKLNFMMVSATYPFYIITGLMVWLPGVALYAYLAHLAVAIIGLPLIFGHIFMATVNPETRVGLSGMVTGWVDREWAKHHYRRWFRDRIEVPEQQRAARELAARLAKPAKVRCGSCDEIAEFGSWRDLIQRSFQIDPLLCPSCETPVPLAGGTARDTIREAIMGHLKTRGAEAPFSPFDVEAA